MTIRSPNPVFLRWAGSKKQLLPVLTEMIPCGIGRYVEPFTGSGSLFFASQPQRALLGDINLELMLTYEAVRDVPRQVARYLHAFPVSEAHYYKLRGAKPRSLGRATRAARFIYLNRLCFNGLYRTNLKGEFNVPYGGTDGGKIPSLEQLQLAARILACADLQTVDYEKILEQTTSSDFVYMDPPYAVRARRTFREYSPTEFGDRQLETLRGWMLRLDKQGIPFIVSYADSAEALRLSPGFNLHRVQTRRNIAGFHGHRKVAMECLISNY